MADEDGRLHDKVVLVTGATGGIGVALCARFAREGARVVVTDLDPRRAREVKESLQQRPGDHDSMKLDIGVETDWESAILGVRDEFGRLDVLVNNAAISSPGTVSDEALLRWNSVITTNQTGTWLGMKHGGALIEESGGGSIVNMCSILGTVGAADTSIAYQATKGAIRVMTKNAALRWAETGVRVNSVHPGFIGTESLRASLARSEQLQNLIAATPMRRLGTPDEVAAAVAFLASDDSSFMTGSELYVDGGWTAE